MKYYEFSEDDKFINTFKAFPQSNHYAVSGNVYFNSLPKFAGQNQLFDILQRDDSTNEGISLYEYNIDRFDRGLFIEPYLINQGYGSVGWKARTNSTYTLTSEYLPWNQTSPGQTLYHKSRGPVTGTISRSYDTAAQTAGGGLNLRSNALNNASKKYRFLSPYFDLASNPSGDNLLTAKLLNFVYIPSIFYGSTIKRGTVKLDFYFTGSLIGTLEDTGGRGELIQTFGANGNDNVAGIIFYDEGVMILTGSWDINTANPFFPGQFESQVNPSWLYYFNSINDETKFAPFPHATLSNISASFGLSYKGMQHTEALTLLAHAPAGEVNYSNNPTFYTPAPQTSATFNFNGLAAYQSTAGSRLGVAVRVPVEAAGTGTPHLITVFLGSYSVTSVPPNHIHINGTSSTEADMAALLAAAISGDDSSSLVTFGSNIITGQGIKQLYGTVDPQNTEQVVATIGTYQNPAQSGPSLEITIINDPGGSFYTQVTPTLYETSSAGFYERTAPLTNIVSSSVQNFSASYEPTTYISKIGLYDEDKNLIGIAKVASPIKKESRDSYTFKLKLDI